MKTSGLMPQKHGPKRWLTARPSKHPEARPKALVAGFFASQGRPGGFQGTENSLLGLPLAPWGTWRPWSGKLPPGPGEARPATVAALTMAVSPWYY